MNQKIKLYPVFRTYGFVEIHYLPLPYLQGSPLPEVLPDIEAVFSSPDLDEDLASDANFRFFMRTGYEHMLREEREAKAAGAAAADAVQPMVLE